MDGMTESGVPEGRREFFKTLGRGLVLGLTGAGAAYMAKNGRIEVCLQQHSPCTTCVALPQGCGLPKAVTFRKEQGSHGRS